MDHSVFKNSSKTKKPNKKTHTLYQLSTQVPVEKKKKKRSIPKKKKELPMLK